MQTSRDNIFNSLIEKYRQPLANAAYHLCGDREAAQDIVQDTLLAAYRNFDKLRDMDRVGSWLYAILRRKVFSYIRAKKPVLELNEELPASCHDEADSLVRKIIIDQMNKLSRDDREILAGKYLLGLSYHELSESLGINENTVRVRCFRAKEKLRKVLRGAGVKARGDNDDM